MIEKLKKLLQHKTIDINTSRHIITISFSNQYFDKVNQKFNKELAEIFLILRKIKDGEV